MGGHILPDLAVGEVDGGVDHGVDTAALAGTVAVNFTALDVDRAAGGVDRAAQAAHRAFLAIGLQIGDGQALVVINLTAVHVEGGLCAVERHCAAATLCAGGLLIALLVQDGLAGLIHLGRAGHGIAVDLAAVHIERTAALQQDRAAVGNALIAGDVAAVQVQRGLGICVVFKQDRAVSTAGELALAGAIGDVQCALFLDIEDTVSPSTLLAAGRLDGVAVEAQVQSIRAQDAHVLGGLHVHGQTVVAGGGQTLGIVPGDEVHFLVIAALQIRAAEAVLVADIQVELGNVQPVVLKRNRIAVIVADEVLSHLGLGQLTVQHGGSEGLSRHTVGGHSDAHFRALGQTVHGQQRMVRLILVGVLGQIQVAAGVAADRHSTLQGNGAVAVRHIHRAVGEALRGSGVAGDDSAVQGELCAAACPDGTHGSCGIAGELAVLHSQAAAGHVDRAALGSGYVIAKACVFHSDGRCVRKDRAAAAEGLVAANLAAQDVQLALVDGIDRAALAALVVSDLTAVDVDRTAGHIDSAATAAYLGLLALCVQIGDSQALVAADLAAVHIKGGLAAVQGNSTAAAVGTGGLLVAVCVQLGAALGIHQGITCHGVAKDLAAVHIERTAALHQHSAAVVDALVAGEVAAEQVQHGRRRPVGFKQDGAVSAAGQLTCALAVGQIQNALALHVEDTVFVCTLLVAGCLDGVAV